METNLNGPLRRHMDRVKEILNDYSENAPGRVSEVIGPLLTSHGKLLRPAYLIISSMFGNGPNEKIYQIAASLELFHIATLAHDDIIDQADERRGTQTINSHWGPKNAVLAGDYLLAAALGNGSKYADPKKITGLTAIISRICAGEIDQSFDRYNFNISYRTYLRRITAKTALLFAAAGHLGAEDSDCGADIKQNLRRAGLNLGISFQIIDDILDMTGGAGKSHFADIKNGIPSLPILLAIKENKNVIGLLPKKARKSKARGIPGGAKFILEKTNSLNEAKDKAEYYIQRGNKEIAKLPAGKAKELLSSFYNSLLHRNY